MKLASPRGPRRLARAAAARRCASGPAAAGSISSSAPRAWTRCIEHVPGRPDRPHPGRGEAGRPARTLSGSDQMLAIDPPEEGATIGGIVAANSSGPRRYRYGTVRDLIIGITVVLHDGTVAKAGGKVVKNVAGYDLSKLFTGSLGTLGVIANANFRLHPHPGAARTVALEVDRPQQAQAAAQAIVHSQVEATAVELHYGENEKHAGGAVGEHRPGGIDANRGDRPPSSSSSSGRCGRSRTRRRHRVRSPSRAARGRRRGRLEDRSSAGGTGRRAGLGPRARRSAKGSPIRASRVTPGPALHSSGSPGRTKTVRPGSWRRCERSGSAAAET